MDKAIHDHNCLLAKKSSAVEANVSRRQIPDSNLNGPTYVRSKSARPKKSA